MKIHFITALAITAALQSPGLAFPNAKQIVWQRNPVHTCANTPTTLLIGILGVKRLFRKPAKKTSLCSYPLATARAIGAMSWRKNLSRMRKLPVT